MNDMVRFVEVEGWQVAVAGVGDEEAKIRDIDLAERLGYAAPRSIRKLIKRMIAEGKLVNVCVRSTVSHTQMPTGGTRVDNVEEYWLTESQAIKVIAKADTEIADKILDQVIRVFLYVRKQGLQPQLTGYTDPVAQRLHAEAESLNAKRKYYEDTEMMVAELERRQLITAETGLAHRIALIKSATGYDLMKAPIQNLSFENTVLVQGDVVRATQIEPTGGLRTVGVQVRAIADMTGFTHASKLSRRFNVSAKLIGDMARAVGIFEKVTATVNEWGVFSPLDSNGGKIKDNWVYSEKAVALLATLFLQFNEKRNTLSKRVNGKVRTQGSIVELVAGEWLKVNAPNPLTVN